MESKDEILKSMGGIPEAVYDAIVQSFYEEAKGRLAVIKASVESNNFEEIAMSAHAIKGSAGNLRLTQIQEVAKALELAAKANNSSDVIKFQEQLISLIP